MSKHLRQKGFTAQELTAQLADPNCTYPADQRWFFELIKINLAEDINERYFSAKEIKEMIHEGHKY